MKANYVHKDSTTLVQDKFIKNGVFSLEYDKETLRDIVLELQEENKKQKEVIDKAIEYINENLIISSILDGKKYYTISDYSFDYRELLDILKEVKTC